MAISKQLTEMMKGETWVQSQENKGSTFHFTVNLKTLPDEYNFHSGKSLDQDNSDKAINAYVEQRLY